MCCLFRGSDGKGQLYFKDKTIVVDNFGSQFLSSGHTYKISMNEFELVREMGRGQYGVVLLVRHLPSDRLMALKDIGLELGPDSLKTISMELEVLTMASATPYILDFYGAFHNRASIFLCLEYMDVGSLESLYKTHGRLPEPIIRAVALAVARGLRFLTKELKVMHRDVKPSNILVNTQGAVKLCDFGVSGHLVRSLARTQIGSMCYMAPERIVMEQDTGYTAKADVWSLGVTLYESAMAEPLFSTTKYDGPFAQLMAVVNDPPPTLPEAEFSPDFRDFIQCWYLQVTRRQCVPTHQLSPNLA